MSQASNTIRIDIVSDVVCPWCIIGYKQLERAIEETGSNVEVHWHPFELNPQMADEGENLREHLAAKYGTTLEDSIKARDKLTELGAELGFTFSYADDMRMYNTFRAHQLLHWADGKGRKHDLKLALFGAFFSRRENISNIKVLAAVAESIGLVRQEAEKILTEELYAKAVRKAEESWIAKGIRGVPAMIFNNREFVSGAQGVANYTSVLRHFNETQAA